MYNFKFKLTNLIMIIIKAIILLIALGPYILC